MGQHALENGYLCFHTFWQQREGALVDKLETHKPYVRNFLLWSDIIPETILTSPTPLKETNLLNPFLGPADSLASLAWPEEGFEGDEKALY
jgi:hypothetical protein